MRIPKVYLETTMFNYYFQPEREAYPYVVKLFEEIKDGQYLPFTSSYVIEELEEAHEPKRTKMMGLVQQYDIEVLRMNEDAERLAQIYVAEGIIPQTHPTDAIHIAMTSVYDLDFIVSLNFKHIVKRKTVLLTESINIREGYKRVGIFSPEEIAEYGEES